MFISACKLYYYLKQLIYFWFTFYPRWVWFSFSSCYFLSINLLQWDITVEFLCQVTLLWWLNNCFSNTSKSCGLKWERKKTPLTLVATFRHILWVTQTMSQLKHCSGHQHLWWQTDLNCKIGPSCWPTSFRFGPSSSVFSHPTRSEAMPSLPLISQ